MFGSEWWYCDINSNSMRNCQHLPCINKQADKFKIGKIVNMNYVNKLNKLIKLNVERCICIDKFVKKKQHLK